MFIFFFFFKQKTAYEMRISDGSSDVCSSDLDAIAPKDRVERRRDHRTKSIFVKRPHRMFAARPAADILAGDEDLRIRIGCAVHQEVRRFFATADRDIAPAGEQAVGPAGLAHRLPPARGGEDRKSVGEGKGGSVRVDSCGWR